MEALNSHLAKWVAEYNATVHSATGRTPNEAFAEEGPQRYFTGDEAALDDAFRNRITRKVAKDSTVRVDHVLYDVPMGLVGERVEIRWTPGRADDVWVVMPDGSRRRVSPTDKQENAETKRVKYTIDFTNGGE
jgi:hypothetical protein